MDLFWPGVCIVEMKRPSEVSNLPKHRAQALEYWQQSGTPSTPAPRYVVLCAFHRFEIWEPGPSTPSRAPSSISSTCRTTSTRSTSSPVASPCSRVAARSSRAKPSRSSPTSTSGCATASAADLRRPARLHPPVCVGDVRRRPAHAPVARLHPGRAGASRTTRRGRAPTTSGACSRSSRRKDRGPSTGCTRARPVRERIALRPSRARASRARRGRAARARGGASTGAKSSRRSSAGCCRERSGRSDSGRSVRTTPHEADILKVVLPTIVEPWRERIAACRTLADVQQAQNDLMHYVVLDPACGSGNFLYVAYRELRRIEAELRRRETDMRRSAGHARAADARSLLPALEHARDRDRPVRRPARPRHALDGTEASGRRARARPRAGAPAHRSERDPARRRAAARLAARRRDHRQPAVPRDRSACAASSATTMSSGSSGSSRSASRTTPSTGSARRTSSSRPEVEPVLSQRTRSSQNQSSEREP